MKEMHIVPPNMLLPRFITIAHNRYNIGAIAGAKCTSIPKRKHKRKKRERMSKGSDRRKRECLATAKTTGEFPPRS
jgi:hypothetical protein